MGALGGSGVCPGEGGAGATMVVACGWCIALTPVLSYVSVHGSLDFVAGAFVPLYLGDVAFVI